MIFDPKRMTTEERNAYEQYQNGLKEKGLGESTHPTSQLYFKYKAVRHMDSRYPKNYLDVLSLPKKYKEIYEDYLKLLDTARDEKPLHDFFDNQEYFIASMTETYA